MQYGKNRVKTKEDAITELIGMLRRSDLSADDVALIQGMMVENPDDADTEKIVKREFDDILRYEPEPAAETYRSLNEVRARLGMKPAPQKRRSFLRTWPARVAAAAVVAVMAAAGVYLMRDSAGD